MAIMIIAPMKRNEALNAVLRRTVWMLFCILLRTKMNLKIISKIWFILTE